MRFIFFILFILLLSPKGGTLFYIYGIRWVYVMLVSFLGTYLFTPFFIKISHKVGILDIPDEERKFHKKPTPLLGGFAILIGFIIACIRNLRFTPSFLSIVIAGIFVYFSGFIDDWKKGVSATLRLFLQFFAVTLIIVNGVRITAFPHFFGENFLEIFFTYLGVIGIINAVNYFDGLNGLASLMSISSGISFLIIAISTNQIYLSFILSAFIGSILGFLPYNFPKAKIFLGDGGSYFLGFILSSCAIMGSWKQEVYNPLIAIITPVSILSVFIYDMIYTTISRIKNGSVRNFREWLEFTGRDHFHHRLLNLGMGEIKTTLFISGLVLLTGIGGVLIRKATSVDAWLLFLQIVILFLLITEIMLAGREVH
ncbi:MAG: hypothetical protein DRI36_01945 [Caldiserica bacterium]|nr:MAG: hypothetical protein DRI36_01945 [Caldisericota bacterium]